MSAPEAAVSASAPIRICDTGGWTDTWFAGHGVVCNLAVEPAVHVELRAWSIDGDRPPLTIRSTGGEDLITAAVDESGTRGSWALDIAVSSDAPMGASTGTSAAVTVAVLGALDALTPGRASAGEIARAAHRVETERLGRQCGVQDQLAAAHGGICFIEMDSYPGATVTQVELTDEARVELEDRLLLVYLGRGHDSSAVHHEVIAALEAETETEAGPPAQLEPLRVAARTARDALQAGDLDGYGHALIANTNAQAALHGALISADARAVIAAARAAGAVGWKVNGAGGEGGTLAVLAPAGGTQRVAAAVVAPHSRFSLMPIRLRSDGLRVQTQG